VRTAHPTAEVARLTTRFGGEVPELVVARPTLEDTYLRLIAPHAEPAVAAELEEVAR
jgi:ABC-2 type transport system ATP-binding protein